MKTKVKVALGIGIASIIGGAVYMATKKTSSTPPTPPPPEEGLANISGQVVDSQTGAALTGVTVDLITATGETLASTQTLTDGSYTFLNIDPGNYGLSFILEGYESQNTAFFDLVADENKLVNIQLVPTYVPPVDAATIHGAVTDVTTGQPIYRARVILAPGGGTPGEAQQLLTEADGQFYFENFVAGTWILHCEATGYTTFSLGMELVAGDNTYNITLLSASTLPGLSGVVTDATTGNPIAGATVKVQYNTVTKTTVTASNGAYSFENIQPSSLPYNILYTVTATGYLGAEDNFLLQTGSNVLNVALTPETTPPPPEEPAGNLTIYLKNLPAGADIWEILIASGDEKYSAHPIITEPTGLGKYDLWATHPASFNVPTSWVKPYRCVIVIFQLLSSGGESVLQQLFYFTNISWDSGTPGYKPVYIPNLDTWYFDVSKMTFSPG